MQPSEDPHAAAIQDASTYGGWQDEHRAPE
jgi:hypothetical protein